MGVLGDGEEDGFTGSRSVWNEGRSDCTAEESHDWLRLSPPGEKEPLRGVAAHGSGLYDGELWSMAEEPTI